MDGEFFKLNGPKEIRIKFDRKIKVLEKNRQKKYQELKITICK